MNIQVPGEEDLDGLHHHQQSEEKNEERLKL